MMGVLSRSPEPAADPDPRAEAAAAQRAAADPRRHAFVSANAGSGKTKVLVDRVISLLLAGAAPDRILCLTYTKAAASEMRARLFRRLGDWAVATDDALARALEEAGLAAGLIPADAAGLARVRGLFAQALETPGGLKIQTIHAFCERVLRRFPLEAGLAAGFEVLDEAAAKALAARAAAGGAASPEDAALREAHGVLAAAVGEEEVRSLIAWIQGRAGVLEALFTQAGGLEPVADALRARLGVTENDTAAGVAAQAWAATPVARLRDAAEALATGSAADKKRAAALRGALAAPDGEAAFSAYCAALFTDKGEGPPPKGALVTKATAAAWPDVADFLAGELDRIATARDTARAAATAALSVAGLTLAHRFVAVYARLKRQAGLVDFADLIARAQALVGASEAAQWVLYKLDGGIDHVLLDEAQDTAPEQWALIEALTGEFIAGEGGARGAALAPTVFAVGDEKQSIYSFQGAAPEKFLEAGQRVAEREPARYVGPTLRVSFRSAPAILTAVDAVFAHSDLTGSDLAAALSPRGDIPKHRADRTDIEGGVALWPLVPAPEKPEPSNPWAPVDAVRADHQDDVLARRIAEHLAGLLREGAQVSVRDGPARRRRPLRPGDVMILLRRRSNLFRRIVQRLKGAGLPAAGADRLVLAEHGAVEDVIGAARVALLPSDDLALAELLKSPLLHPAGAAEPPIDDGVLFDLAHGRGGTLWDALHESADPRCAEARALTRDLALRAERESPYAFFAGLLDRASATGESYGRRLAARWGPEAQEPLREVLALALAQGAAPAPSLQGFVHALARDATPVKREGDGARDEIRVMTVHGAKGLEAPLVILPDAGEAAGGKGDGGLFADGETGLMWSPRKAADPAAAAGLRAARETAARQEDLRLLYVAMTRAEDQLIVCGAGGPRRGGPDSWWARAAAGLETLGARAHETPTGAGRMWGAALAAAGPVRAGVATPSVSVPRWALTPVGPVAEEGGTTEAILAPSRLVAADAHPVVSPVAVDGAPRDRFQRGRWIHRLLELLPDAPPAARRARGAQLLAAEGVAAAEQAPLLEEVMRILEDPAFAVVFGPGSQAEAAIVGDAGRLAPGRIVNGRVDRLAVTAEAVYVIDYKSDRPPPDDPADVGAAYRAQLAAYRAVLRTLYPGRPVRCALLWTFTPRLMAMPDWLLDEAPPLA